MRLSRIAAVLLFAFRLPGAQFQADVVIYGGTPAGLAAAAAATREGASVIVAEPTTHIGGMIAGGIACTDTGTPQLVGGIAAEFFNQVAAETRRSNPNPRPPTFTFRGETIAWRGPREWDLEPKTARLVFERWVKEGGYKLLTNVHVTSVKKRGARILAMKLSDGSTLSGAVFIDASYEGDLMALAGVSNTYGREAASQYGERLNGVQQPHFIRDYTEQAYRTPGSEYMHHGQFGADIPARDARGKLYWGVEASAPEPAGSADRRIQAYCYRLVVTQRADLKLPWPRPDHYDPGRYELLLRYIQAHPGIAFARLIHLYAVPNGKYDLNASGPFSIDYVGGNRGYPEASWAQRERMLEDHRDYEKGFFWFLAHDPRVPAELREEVNSWGIARDEWPDTNNWPVQIYARESRRMTGSYVMTGKDILENKTKEDSVGMGSFVLDSHWVRRIANERGFVRVEGHLDESIDLARAPYQIPYRALTPKPNECQNLLVPVCVSATHVAICTIRMEPVYMILGHSAGVAAALAAKSHHAVQDVVRGALLEKLSTQRQVLHK